ARLPIGTTAGTVAAGDDTRIARALQNSNNLSDVVSASTARTNLGLSPVAASGSYVDLSNTPDLGLYATLASPTFTGVPRVPTPASNSNDTTVPNTQWVQAAIVTGQSGVASFNGRVGGITLNSTDVTNAL